ncbi:uncharacterized protein N7483_009167 [Penicillium malachiteum]|uniref:uncharacterized protein n=1 Tax=Penicillium malachiteum TaxID=1324776 RepID=UPI002549821E|nr:uncharacterized protein N7483_009167 [Penicillium malachiteum]KAJ5721233.1 hypothetical protein N7483_009167 [Penicillium malachiteum]
MEDVIVEFVVNVSDRLSHAVVPNNHAVINTLEVSRDFMAPTLQVTIGEVEVGHQGQALRSVAAVLVLLVCGCDANQGEEDAD